MTLRKKRTYPKPKSVIVNDIVIDLDDYISISEAVVLTGYGKYSIRKWALESNIGIRAGDRIWIHKEKLKLFCGPRLDDKNYYTPDEVAVIVGYQAQAVRRWCKKYGIGVKSGDKYWLVDKQKLELLLRGSKLLT